MAGLGKKPAMMADQSFAAMCDKVSKAALIDVLWCACQLGTDETAEQITAQAARNIVIALGTRGDRCPRDIVDCSKRPIDSD